MSSRLSTLGAAAAASPQLLPTPGTAATLSGLRHCARGKPHMIIVMLLLLVLFPATACAVPIDSIIHSYVVNCVPVALGPGADAGHPMLTTPALDKNGPGCRAAKRAVLAKFDGKADALQAFEDSLATPRYAMEPEAAWKRFQATEQHVYPQLEDVDPAPARRHPIGSTHLFRKFLEGKVTAQRPRPLGRSHSMPHLSRTPTAVKTTTGFVQEEEITVPASGPDGKSVLPFLDREQFLWPCRSIPFCLQVNDPDGCTTNGVGPFFIAYQALAGATQLLAPTGVRLWPADRTDVCQCQIQSRTTPYHIIRIQDRRGDGCHSVVGMQKRDGKTDQELQIDTTFVNSYIVVHEVLHALGFAHMHQRFDRDDYVTVPTEYNQKAECTNNYNIVARIFYKYAGQYEYMSVMHYGPGDGFGCRLDAAGPLRTMITGNYNWIAKGTQPTCYNTQMKPGDSCEIGNHYHKGGFLSQHRALLSHADLESVRVHYAEKPDFHADCFFTSTAH